MTDSFSSIGSKAPSLTIGEVSPTGFTSLFEDLFNLEPQYVNPRVQLNKKVNIEDNFAVVEVEVPGVSPGDIKVKVEGRSISVETPKGNCFVTIGQRLDTEGTTATLKYGLLTIRIPKRGAKIVEVSVNES